MGNFSRFRTADNNHHGSISKFGANSRRLNLQFFLNFVFFVHIAVIKAYPQIAIKD